MTFWTYLFANTVISLAVAAILIWTKPENRAKRAETKMRREEDLFNMMLEAAKRIDEERKPNPEFTPPPEKKPHGYHLTMTIDDAKDYGKTHTFNGEEYERTMVAQSADGSVVSMTYRRKHSQPKPYPHDIEALKAPTTGTSAIKPKRRWDSWDENDAEFEKVIRYAVEHECSYRAAQLALASGYNSAQKAKPTTTGKSVVKPKQTDFFIGEIRGGPGNQVLGTVTAKSAEELKEKLEAFSKQPITVFDSAKEGWETKQISPEEAKTLPCKLCKHYVSDEMRDNYGYCVRNDEIMGAYDRKGCFERKVAPDEMCCENCAYLSTLGGDNICAHTGLHVYAIGTRMYCANYIPKARTDKPKPLRTVTTR